MYTYTVVRPFLFDLNEEDAHMLALHALQFVEKHPLLLRMLRFCYQVRSEMLEKEVFGIVFPNPIGLAAGFAKNAEALLALEALGFGFIEVGTVLPNYGQPGNPRPRIFRLPKDNALINRMGFNSKGAERVGRQLRRYRKHLEIPIGINLGKLKNTRNEDAFRDYGLTFDQLYEEGDYFVVNVSSPNTPGLRHLQDRRALEKILSHLNGIRLRKEQGKKKSNMHGKPILVKVSPDLSVHAFDELLEVVGEQAEGLVCANTTISREGLLEQVDEPGGVSGRPLLERSIAMVAYAKEHGFRLPIIGVGGIDSCESAQRMEGVGADLVQVFTGFVYEGPSLPKHLNRGIIRSFVQD